jgi:selenocysteine lyase/cysteine desulfurase
MNIQERFIGANTIYPLANGGSKPRIHLDGAASPLVMQDAMDAFNALLPHYSNSHSHSHASAQIMSEAMAWSLERIQSFTGANTDYCCVFMGSGSTALLNNIARRLSKMPNEKSTVLVSALEHHANDLPHRHNANVIHFSLYGENQDQGDIDLNELEILLKENQGHIRYVTFSAVSNVTGIVSPIKEITDLAHKYDAYSVIDCAQMAAHLPLNISDNNADFIVFSGHKVYAGAAPGVMIAKRSLLEKYPSDEMGGGIVDHVGYRNTEFTNSYPARELPGTKNILGAYALASVFNSFEEYGFDKIQQHGYSLWQEAYQKLSAISEISIYGKSKKPRVGALSFNIKGIDHGLAASILSDYYGIGIRNECFCAHPYVSSLLKEELWSLDLSNIADEDQDAFINSKRGMLRASFSLYNTSLDVDELCSAISDLIKNIDQYRTEYTLLSNGDYAHKQFKLNWTDFL